MELPRLGVGLGFRNELADLQAQNTEEIDWVELQADSFIPVGPAQAGSLGAISGQWPCIPHFVNLSIGSPDQYSQEYVECIRDLVHRVDAPWFSDHLCFTSIDGRRLGHLTPLYRTSELAMEVAEKAKKVQADVGRPLLLENITYPFDIGGDLTEPEFISNVIEKADCGLLLDLANLYVNSKNHGFDPYEHLAALPLDRVGQIHVAGNQLTSIGLLADSHDSPVPDEVWQLLDFTLARSPVRSILLERDANFPSEFAEISRDLAIIRRMIASHE